MIASRTNPNEYKIKEKKLQITSSNFGCKWHHTYHAILRTAKLRRCGYRPFSSPSIHLFNNCFSRDIEYATCYHSYRFASGMSIHGNNHPKNPHLFHRITSYFHGSLSLAHVLIKINTYKFSFSLFANYIFFFVS